MNVGEVKPINLNEETAYLAGVIVGDGHISNSFRSKNDISPHYRIYLEISDLRYIKKIENLIKKIISTKSSVKSKPARKNKKQSYYLQITNKSLYYFLAYDLGIPKGKKCYAVCVPEIIFLSSKLQKYFLAGVFDTDGGVRGDVVGFTSASSQLINDIAKILQNLGFEFFQETWYNKRYDRNYFGIKLKSDYIDNFLSELPVRNERKLTKSRLHAGVPEWSNGTDNSTG